MSNIWLDDEQKFYNYRTAEIDGDNIFDTHRASNSDAQQILEGSKYWREEKNTYSEIIEMTPTEYFERCAKDCFDEPVETLIQSRRRDAGVLDHLKQVILKYKKRFPLCYIDYATEHNASQEGLHRMMVAGDLFGWDKKFPVQIIKWVDEDRAKKAFEWQHIRQIERYLQIATEKALRYKYFDIEELKDQIKSEFETEVRYLDEFEDRDFKLEIYPKEDGLIDAVVDDKYRYEFDSHDIIFIDASEKDTDDLEDVDLDDLSDWMKDLLKDINEDMQIQYTNPNNYLKSDTLLNDLKKEFGENYSTEANPKDVCKYVAAKCKQCELKDILVCACSYDHHGFEILNRDYAVIRIKDTVYDYCYKQFADKGIDVSKPLRILELDPSWSKIHRMNVYTDNDYAIITQF